jgi:hypothetical protein
MKEPFAPTDPNTMESVPLFAAQKGIGTWWCTGAEGIQSSGYDFAGI